MSKHVLRIFINILQPFLLFNLLTSNGERSMFNSHHNIFQKLQIYVKLYENLKRNSNMASEKVKVISIKVILKKETKRL